MFHTRSKSLFLVLVAAWLVTGCVPIINKPAYPIEWVAATFKRIGTCPAIEGTYVNQGKLYIEAGIRCDLGRGYEGRWSCDLQLAPNLGIAVPAVNVQIAQPDAETMSVGLLNEGGILLESHSLHLGKDYQCNAEGLYFSSSGSMMEGRALSGAMFHLSRAFVRDIRSGLVMTVREDTSALVVFLGVVKSDTSYVRWMPAGVADPPSNTPP
jgi:hypothetical protein